jgi:hypothetical protein
VAIARILSLQAPAMKKEKRYGWMPLRWISNISASVLNNDPQNRSHSKELRYLSQFPASRFAAQASQKSSYQHI